MLTEEEIVKRLLAALGEGERSAGFAKWSPEDIAEYTRARDAFIEAGLARLRDSLPEERWIQINVVTSQRRAFLAGPFRQRLEGWLKEGAVSRFFFMNKPPGLRLRFLCSRETRETRERLAAFFAEERTRGAIEAFAPAVYDAESHQFGGEEGVQLMHEHAHHDSLAVLQLLEADGRDALSADLSTFSLLFVNDLIKNVVGDIYEGWDIWKNMSLTERGIDDRMDAHEVAELERDADQQRPVLMATWQSPESLIERLSARDQELTRGYFAANARWSASYRSVVEGGKLRTGIRKVLPFYIIFHWNRLGFSYDQQCCLAFFMQRTLDPKRDVPAIAQRKS